MIKRNIKLINQLNIFSDVLVNIFAYMLAVFIRFNIMGGIVSISLSNGTFLVAVTLYSLLIMCAYLVAGLYTTGRFKRRTNENFTIAGINLVGVLAFSTILFFLKVQDFSRIALGLFWVISTLAIIVKRALGRALLHYYRSQGYNQHHVIVIGNGHLAEQYIQDMKADPRLGITVDGYVSKSVKPELGTNLGSYEDIESILDGKDYDSMVVALEPHETIYMGTILAAADKEGIHVDLIPFYNDYIPSHPTIESVGKTKLINMRATPMDSLGWSACKRGLDIIGSLVIILLLSPILLITAIGVKITSPGPVFFKQERVGKNRKPFQMLKFRSMRIDTPDDGWTVDNDPRKTKFGSFIRKYSIDELPQAFNVLKGDMSLVGPRPEIPKFVRQFKEEVPLYLVRQQVRPGMTGWAQIHGLRGDTSIEDRVEYDIWYIENWSIWLDVQILWKTIFHGKFMNQEELRKK